MSKSSKKGVPTRHILNSLEKIQNGIQSNKTALVSIIVSFEISQISDFSFMIFIGNIIFTDNRKITVKKRDLEKTFQ